MMWGFYLWPGCGLGLIDRRRALVERLRDLAEPALRIPRRVFEATNTMATSSALLLALFRTGR
jgi:hypothetical protein